jgi:hypothetical protein
MTLLSVSMVMLTALVSAHSSQQAVEPKPPPELQAALAPPSDPLPDGRCEVIVPDRAQLPPNVRRVSTAIEAGKGALILDAAHHRLLDVDPAFKVRRQIGSIGQGPGELWKPQDFVTGSDGRIYVLNSFGGEIVILDSAGHEERRFALQSQASTLAVDSKGRILVVQPQQEQLITIYNHKGQKTGAIGRLRKVSELLGDKLKPQESSWRYGINRVHIAVDAADNVYAAFQSVPYLEKYDRAGRLLWTRRITGPRPDFIVQHLSAGALAPLRQGYADDRVSMPLVLTDIAVSPSGSTFYLGFSWNTSWVYVARADGSEVGCFEPPPQSSLFGRLAPASDGRVIWAAEVLAPEPATILGFPLPEHFRPR